MQAELRTRTRYAIPILLSAALLAAAAGCHRAPSAEVVATVNGKQLLRADLERNYLASLGDTPQKPSAVEADIRRLQVLQILVPAYRQ